MGQRLMAMMGRRQGQMQQPFQGVTTGGNMWQPRGPSNVMDRGAAGGNMFTGNVSPPNSYQYNPVPGTTWDPPEAPRAGGGFANAPAPTGGGPGMAGDIPFSDLGRAPSPLANAPAPTGGGTGMFGDIPASEAGLRGPGGVGDGPTTNPVSPQQLAQALMRGGPSPLADIGTAGGNMWQPGMPTQPGINPPRLMDIPRPGKPGLMPPGGWQ